MKNEDKNTKKDYYIRIRYVDIEGKKVDKTVPVSKEVYHAYKRPEWAEERQKERDSRCLISTKTGKAKRCTDDCSKCKWFRSGTAFSLEKMEEDGMDTTDRKSFIEEAVMYRELLSALMDALDELDPDKRAIAQAIMDGKKDKEAAKELGYAAASTYNYQKRQLLASLKERLDKYR